MKTVVLFAVAALLASANGFSADIMPPPSSPGSPSDHPFPPGERTPQNDWPTNMMVHAHNEMTTNLPPLTNNWSGATNNWRTNRWSGTNDNMPHSRTNKWHNTNGNWPEMRTNRWSGTNARMPGMNPPSKMQ